MSETTNEETELKRSVEDNLNVQRRRSEEVLTEWRASDQVENAIPSTSPLYWDIDYDNNDDYGKKSCALYGKNTWKIEKFSEISKRELRSNVFEVGGYKWYILIYPQGCDTCNHLSIFLCVAEHDKLLPGWNHFAQFTVAIVNKEPRKWKHSDTLHRFWKKEHDWGWKKFMELTKLQEGFIDDSNSLTIKVRIQVIRERVDRPFRCLCCVYRRELIRVYLRTAEQSCWRVVEEQKNKFTRFRDDKAKFKSFSDFWLSQDENSKRGLSREKMDVILKLVVKQYFIEKEVQSTLVMDTLYSGLKAIEGQSKNKKSGPKDSSAPAIIIDKDMFVLADDFPSLLDRAIREPLLPKDTKARTKDVSAIEEIIKEPIERHEKHLTELGRRTMETFVLSHIFSTKIEVAHQEAIAWKRQEELIREEEEAWLAESEQKAKRGAAEKEKKLKKKQAKQKKNKNRGKEKKKEEKSITEEECVRAKEEESSAEKPDTVEDLSDVSDSVDSSADTQQLDSEDRESSSPVHWEKDASASPPADTSKGKGSSIPIPNGGSERKHLPTMDDSSSTCSNDSIRSSVANGSYKESMSNSRNQKWISNGKTQPGKVSQSVEPSRQSSDHKNQRRSFDVCKVGQTAVISHIKELRSSGERNPISQVKTVPTQEKTAAILSPPRAVPSNLPSMTQAKMEKRVVSNVETVPNRKPISARSITSDKPVQTVTPRADIPKTAAAPKPTAQPAISSMSRPLSAPIIPPKQAAAPVITTTVQTSTKSLSRSVSSTGRLGSPTHSKPFIPQSYKHAIVGSSVSNQTSSQSTGVSVLPSYSHPPASSQSGFPIKIGSWDVSSSGGLLFPGGLSSNGVHRTNPYNTTHVAATASTRPANLVTDEFPHLDIINDLLEDEHGIMDSSLYHVPQWFNNNNQYLFHGGGVADLGVSGRSRSFNDDGFHQMAHPSSYSSYGNRQMDGLTPAEWQMASMDLSLLAMSNQEEATVSGSGSYSYFDLEPESPQNYLARINGYREFRPSNGY